MKADFSINVKGVAELNQAIRAFSPKLAERIYRTALRQGANYMMQAIRANAPVKTGRLRKSIKLKSSRINRPDVNGKVGLFITVDRGKSRKDPKGAWYGPWVEIGYNRGSKLISGSSAVSAGIITREEHQAKKQAKANHSQRYGLKRMSRSIKMRIGGKAVPGKHFVKSTYLATRDQSERLVSNGIEQAAKEVIQELGLRLG